MFESLRSIATPELDRVIKVVTDLGSTTFYMIVIPILYWCISKSLGFGLAIVLSVSNYINVGIKFIVCRARPYVAFPTLTHPILKLTGTGYHSPAAMLKSRPHSGPTWPVLSGGWVALVGITVVVVVAFTRVYATVHYPTDVLVGAPLGLAIALVYSEIERRLRTSNTEGMSRVGLQLAVSIVLPGLVFALSAHRSPAFTEEVAQVLGFLAGAGIGYTLENAYVKYDVRAGLPVQVVKVILGMAGLMGVRYGLKALFPDTALWNMIRYAAVAIWATLGAPFVFRALFGQKA